MAESTKGILLAMKEQLVKGWVQGEFKKDEGVCLYGALNQAAGLKPRLVVCDTLVRGRGTAKDEQISAPILTKAYVIRDNPAALEAMVLLRDAAGVDQDDLALWNDAEGRTQEDVVGLIDEALQALDKESDGLRGSAPADQPSEAGVR